MKEGIMGLRGRKPTPARLELETLPCGFCGAQPQEQCHPLDKASRYMSSWPHKARQDALRTVRAERIRRKIRERTA